MPIKVKCGAGDVSAARKTGRIGRAAAAVVLAIGLGVSSGAFAQCVGTHHAGSGAGAHGSASSGGGAHSGSSATHTAASSACATAGATANAAHVAALHPAAVSGAGKPGVGSAAHRTVSQTASVSKPAAVKRVGGNGIKP